MKLAYNTWIIILTTFLINLGYAQAQNNVGIGTGTPHQSAILDIESSDKGVLVPRMTSTQRAAIAMPADGLLVYDTDSNSFWYYSGSNWKNISTIPDKIQDEDGNTKIMVEKNPDEDIIRFELAGDEKMILTKNQGGQVRLELISAGRNTMIGQNSGADIDVTAADVTGLGYLALGSNTTGLRNTAMGSGSMSSNTSGLDNTAIGYNALKSNTTWRRSTAIGARAMENMNPSTDYDFSRNTAVGVDALRGSNNLALNTGVYNTAMGDFCLGNNSSGYYNTAVGAVSMVNNSTGFRNSALGAFTLNNNTTGADNVAVGSFSLYENINGNGNISLGYGALFNNTSGSENIAIGHFSQQTNLTGTRNIAIGYNSGPTSINQQNSTSIGNYANANCSNCMVLGSATTANKVNVGININNPTERLHVDGNMLLEGKIIQEAVISPNLNTGYTNVGSQFETVGFYKDKEGRVHLQGTIAKNAGAPIVAFTLPVGYRPAKELRFAAYRHSDQVTRVAIDSWGSVLIPTSMPDGTQISLDGISFRVD